MSFRNDTLEAKAREHVWRATSPRARPTQESTSRGTTRCVRTSFPAHSLDSRARTLSSSSPKPRAVEINKNRWIAGRRRRGCPASLRASFHPRLKYSFRLSRDEKLDTVLTPPPPLPLSYPIGTPVNDKPYPTPNISHHDDHFQQHHTRSLVRVVTRYVLSCRPPIEHCDVQASDPYSPPRCL
jgi:hypothetical protein